MRRWPGRRTFVAVALAAVAIAAATGAAGALFARSVSSSGTAVTTKRIFPGAHTAAAWSVRDASGGVENNGNEPLSSAGDGRTVTTGAWGTAFAANRWYEADLSDHLATGLAASSITLRITIASPTGTTCVYAEVRRRSTGAVVATKGSTATPLGCVTALSTTLTATVPEVATTDVADDLRVRVYGRNTLSSSATLDEITVTGSTPYGTFTLLPVVATNAATGTAAVTRWAMTTAGDGAVYTSASNWKGGYDAARWIRFGFLPDVPTGATITGVTFTHTFRDQDGVSACYWFEAYAGTTLLAAHGSSSAAYCQSGTAYRTEVHPLPEVTTPAQANSLNVRLFMWNGSGTKRTQHDVVTVTVSYYLD